MSKFDEMAFKDLESVFFEEFAEKATVNKKQVSIIFDDDMMNNYRKEGIFQGEKLVYILQKDFPDGFSPNEPIVVNDRKWFVESCRVSAGLLEIVLKSFMSQHTGGMGR